MTKNISNFYHDKPIFGLDIGFSSIKVMQISRSGNSQEVSGYGVCSIDANTIRDGVIIDPESIAKAILNLFNNQLIGDISTNRCIVAIPASRTFTRSITLPNLKNEELSEAIRLETEQYVPVPLNELYLDYGIVSTNDKEQEILAVAVPSKIVDSYVQLTNILGLEVVAVESSISAASRLFKQAEQSDVPTILIDFGSISSDITIYDNGVVVTGTASGGGDSFTSAIADKLNVSIGEAHVIKTKYGLGVSKKQKEITDCLNPILDLMLKEIRRMIRYFEERSDKERKIGQVVTMGGGANMPGLSEHMTNLLRLPVRLCDPWQHIKFGKLELPNSAEKSMYVTVSGLALTDPKEIFNND